MSVRQYYSSSAAATAALGEAVGRIAPVNLVLALDGDLGAGKTVWVRGMARGLGQRDNVESPTFTLLQSYTDPDARLPLHHFDCYRLQNSDEFVAAGLDDYLRTGGVAVLEWAEIVKDILPEDSWQLRLVRIGETAWEELPDGTILLPPDSGKRKLTLTLPEHYARQLDELVKQAAPGSMPATEVET